MVISKSQYEGYLWFSNEKKPLVLDKESFELEIPDDANPFVVEGFLFDGTKSISIKYLDGKYHIYEYNINDFADQEFREVVFFSHRMDGRKLRFRQYMRSVEDELCEEMEVLQPAELVFVGFNNKEE